MQGISKISRKSYVREGIIYFVTYSLILNTSLPAVLATPAGGVFTVGTGTIEYGSDTAVTVNQSQSVIEWGAAGVGGIDTGSAESLAFLQAEGLSNSAVLNRIMSGNPTQFEGVLSGLDMRIFIVNPAGIIFGEGSQVNVSQLVASGLNMSDDAFSEILADESKLMVFRDRGGTVRNLGTITVNAIEVPPPPPHPPPPPLEPVLLFIPAAPIPEPAELEYSGFPALMTWAANELGIDEKMMQTWVVNALASSREIQPCDTCARLKAAAAVLQDADRTHADALARVVNEFVAGTAPISPEQMASIARAIQDNTDPGSRYGMAGEYLDALAAYVGTLNNDMNFSREESITLAADRYVAPLAQNGSAGAAEFVAARLAALAG